MLILFLEAPGEAPGTAERPAGWWRLDAAGRRIAGGADMAGMAPLPGETVLAVPPATAVTLHLVTLPPLAPAQAQAAARALAMELSAAPVEDLHVALGAADADGRRWLALADSEAMAGWVARMDGLGLEAGAGVRLVPAPLLLAQGSCMAWGDLLLVHGDGLGGGLAFAAEPALAGLMCPALPPAQPLEMLGAGLAARLAGLPDLRQGRFARETPWQPASGQLRRLGLLAAAAALALLGAELASLWQLSRAADRLEARLATEAAALLPRGTLVDAPAAQVQARLAALGGQGLGGMLAPLMTALEARPSVSIVSLEQAAGQGLSLLLEGASAGDVAAILAEMRAAGLVAEAGLPRQVSGVMMTEVKVRVP